MGLNLNKVIGWALTDVATTGPVDGYHPIEDARINTGSRLLSTDPDEPTVAEYHAWLVARREAAGTTQGETGALDETGPFDAFLDEAACRDVLDAERDGAGRTTWERHGRLSVRGAVIHQAEYGLGNVLLVRPVSCADWHRRGDVIDGVVEHLTGTPFENSVRVLHHGIYPFSGAYMDAATGHRLPDEVMTWVQLQSRLREEPDLDARTQVQILQACDLMARRLGFADRVEAAARIAPVVPGEVRALCEFGDLFTGDEVWRQLRPVLYTFWA